MVAIEFGRSNLVGKRGGRFVVVVKKKKRWAVIATEWWSADFLETLFPDTSENLVITIDLAMSILNAKRCIIFICQQKKKKAFIATQWWPANVRDTHFNMLQQIWWLPSSSAFPKYYESFGFYFLGTTKRTPLLFLLFDT